MDNMELLEIVNNGLAKGQAVTEIGKGINLTESAIRKRLNRLGYRRVNNEFVLVGDSITKNITPKTKATRPPKNVVVGQSVMEDLPPIKKLNDDVLEGDKIDISSNFTPIMEVAITSEEKEVTQNDVKLQLLLDNLDKLLKLIPTEKQDSEIKSNLKQVTTLRIDSGVYGAVKEYAQNRGLNIGDIVEKSLIDYLNNYL